MTFEHNVKLAGTVTVGPKGQVVIPAEVRDLMNITPGDKLIALYFEDKHSVVLVTEQQAQVYVTQMGEQCTRFNEVTNSGGKK